MTDANYREQLLNTFKLLSEKYLDKWQHGSSKTSFMLFLSPDALCISNYWDARDLRNISIYQIDNNGKVRNNIIVNELEEPELYSAIFSEYEKIKQQVRDAKLENISGGGGGKKSSL